MYKHCTAKLFSQGEPGEEEIEAEEQSIETATDIVNQSLLLFDSSPLKAPMHLSSYTHDRTVKLGILTKPFILNLLRNI